MRSEDIIAAVNAVVGDAQRPLALHEPLFMGNERHYVDSCITQGWVSSVGAYVDRFERELADFCQAPFAVATVNGTAALQVALVALGVQAGEEVLIPSLTFVATANAVMHTGAVVHFVEVEETSLGIDPQALERYLQDIAVQQNGRTINRKTGYVIAALMPVHIFGHPCQTAALSAIAKQYGLAFLEDATEALGSKQDGKPVGSEHPAVFSFNGNKIMTTGGGGAIIMQDEALYHRIKHLTSTAKLPHRYAFNHDEVAWNYRMPNLNAALGCAQLEQLPDFITAKQALAARYIRAFASISGMHILPQPQATESNYWLVTLLADKAPQGWLDDTIIALHEAGLLCRPVWTPLHLLPMYASMPRADLRLTENLATRIINLPSSVKLGLAHG